MKIYKYSELNQSQIKSLCRRPELDHTQLNHLIDDIFKSVKENGDAALYYYTKKFDGLDFDDIMVSEAEILNAINSVDQELKKAIDHAYDNIYTFHVSQKSRIKVVSTQSGVQVWQESSAIERVGLYIPGGSAPLFSTVLMLGIPAQIAGCTEVILCSPPQKNGELNPAILYAASKCGITKINKIGGAQAIAAMCLGTESISPVYKIFGPGNQYVTTAKIKAQQMGVAIDLPAGPSEVLVFADRTANVDYVILDMLSQAEHGPDSQTVLVSTNRKILVNVIDKIKSVAASLPRHEIILRALDHSVFLHCLSSASAFEFINEYAPEHLIIASKSPKKYIKYIKNAGSVFLGNYTPESAGDYASGTNHTLPTSGYAKMMSGTNLDSFVKKITFQHITPEGIKNLKHTVATMARAESLEAHAKAIEIRS